jgi:5-methylcytosine-specific restriction endonuclease McrA
MSLPPWIRPTSPLFRQRESETRGNDGDNHHLYNNERWRKESAKFRLGKKCEREGCILLAHTTDHIIPVRKGGAFYDRRNWQRLCKRHNAIKTGKDAHYTEPSVDTPNGKIPANRAHLPPDIAGESYLLK